MLYFSSISPYFFPINSHLPSTYHYTNTITFSSLLLPPSSALTIYHSTSIHSHCNASCFTLLHAPFQLYHANFCNNDPKDRDSCSTSQTKTQRRKSTRSPNKSKHNSQKHTQTSANKSSARATDRKRSTNKSNHNNQRQRQWSANKNSARTTNRKRSTNTLNPTYDLCFLVLFLCSPQILFHCYLSCNDVINDERFLLDYADSILENFAITPEIQPNANYC